MTKEFINKRFYFLEYATKNDLLVRMEVSTKVRTVVPIEVWRDGDSITFSYRVINDPEIHTEYVEHLPPGAFTFGRFYRMG